MNIDLLRQQQRWKDGLQELRTGLATVEAQVEYVSFCVYTSKYDLFRMQIQYMNCQEVHKSCL